MGVARAPASVRQQQETLSERRDQAPTAEIDRRPTYRTFSEVTSVTFHETTFTDIS
jgi:hypothetical protein